MFPGHIFDSPNVSSIITKNVKNPAGACWILGIMDIMQLSEKHHQGDNNKE